MKKIYFPVSVLCVFLYLMYPTYALTSDFQKEQLLSAHNQARSAVGLPGLIWDDTMARDAESWAQTLARENKFEHSSASDRHDMGENIYYTMTTANSLPSNGSDAVNAWIKEKASYDYASNTCAAGQECGHYRQIVWKVTERVGCGRAKSKTPSGTRVYWVCRYSPAGNYIGQRPY